MSIHVEGYLCEEILVLHSPLGGWLYIAICLSNSTEIIG
jgi:hypothetical protein